MTKQSKSGEENNELRDSFITRDEKHEWIGQEIEVQSDPMIDHADGEIVSLRVFDFGADPITLKRDRPTKQQLFNSHAKQIEAMLWADGMIPITEINPIIQISTKKEKYRIMIWCKARKGNFFSYKDTPRTLQEIITPHATT